MKLDALLSTVILVSFLVTIIMAIGSYAAYKLREARRPHVEPPHSIAHGGEREVIASADPTFFERVKAADVAHPTRQRPGVPRG